MKYILCVVMILLCSSVTAWGLTGSLEEWDTSPLRPYDIAVLNDGSPWLTYCDPSIHDPGDPDGKIFTIDPSTGLTTVYESGLTPAQFEGLDRSIDNTLWIADNEGKIVHFDPSDSTFASYPLPVDLFGISATPTAVKVAPDGSVWFANYLDRSLGRLAPVTGAFQRFPAVGQFSDKPNKIAFSDDGTVWFTIGHGVAPSIGRLDPDTGVIETWSDTDLFTPFGINVVGDTVWFLDHYADILVQFDPSTGIFTKFPTPTELDDAHFFVVDEARGIFWMTAYFGDHIGTFNPTTETFDTLALTSGAGPMGISLSPTGEVWIAETFNTEHGGVGRFIQCTDSDGDGYALEGGACGPADCDDADANTYPGATEVCDGEDNDCDGEIDEGDRDGDGIGDCLDSCPDEDATGLDANGDGCIDDTGGLTQLIQHLVAEGEIAKQLRNSLLSKVNNVEKSDDKENICAAVHQLEAFKNEVTAQRGKKISEEAANLLITYANNVIAGLLTQLPPGETC